MKEILQLSTESVHAHVVDSNAKEGTVEKREEKNETEGRNSKEGTEVPNRLLKVLIH